MSIQRSVPELKVAMCSMLPDGGVLSRSNARITWLYWSGVTLGHSIDITVGIFRPPNRTEVLQSEICNRPAQESMSENAGPSMVVWDIYFGNGTSLDFRIRRSRVTSGIP